LHYCDGQFAVPHTVLLEYSFIYSQSIAVVAMVSFSLLYISLMLSCCKLSVNKDSGRIIVIGRGYGSPPLVPVIILSIHHSHLLMVILETAASE
jgi:hypothetical protein